MEEDNIIPLKIEGYQITSIKHPGGVLASSGFGTKAMGSIGYISDNPFGNCQIGTLCYANNIFRDFNSVNSNEFKAFAEAWCTRARKTELMIDIHRSLEENVERVFLPSEIIFKSQYRNNTQSEMTVYLLQIKRALERLNLWK